MTDFSIVRILAALRRARTLATAGGAGLLLSLAPAAHADTADDAEAKAREILATVQQLQARVKTAESAYDRSLAGVASGVLASMQSERLRERAAARTQAASAAVDQQVRGLYMSGGPMALYATLLSSGSVVELQTGAVMVDRVVAAARDVVDQNAEVLALARVRAQRDDAVADRRIATERSVAQVAARVEALLAQQQELLDAANEKAAHLRELEAARAALAAQQAAFATITAQRLAELRVLPPSAFYASLYHSAAKTCPGLSWTVLAAVGQVESGHGANPSTSYAGAMGPMQFLPATFAHYGVDGGHDGRIDIMDPADAIFSAANYLCANGAGRGPTALANAIWHYNHAGWYVQMVLTLAGRYDA